MPPPPPPPCPRPLRAAGVEDDDAVGELVHLTAVVAHVDHRDAQIVADAQQVRQDPAAALDVHRRERLVEQQDVRRRHQRARQRHPLPLAAREIRHPPIEKLADLQHLRHRPERELLPWTPAIKDVAADAHVRKQRRLLRDVADVPRVRRHVDPATRVEQHSITDRDPATGRTTQPRDGIQRRRLARAGRPEERGDPTGQLLVQLQQEGPCRSVKSRSITCASQPAT